MIPDRAAIVLCERDLELAGLLRDTWAHAGNNVTDLIQVSTDGALLDDIEAIVLTGVPQRHPEAVNWAFKKLISQSKESFNFLFLEPDCAIAPWASDILLSFSQSLAFRGGSILGAAIHVPKYGWTHNGVAYYRHDVGDVIDLSKLPEDEPFDDWISGQIYPRHHSPTAFIKHTQPGGVTKCDSLDIFKKGLIHHGCKDRSLKDLCLAYE